MAKQITQRLMFSFPPSACENPTIYHLVRDYNLRINVFRAKVTPEETGFLVLDLTGEQEDIDSGLKYITSLGIEICNTAKGLTWDADKCTSCGNCLTHCPTHALSIPDRDDMQVKFDDLKCVECLACTRVCPFGACYSVF